MSTTAKTITLLLRLALGWLFFYAGISKLTDPSWSAAGFLQTANTFPEFFRWFAMPQHITWVNLVNAWGLTLIGISLIAGACMRWAAYAGILLMALYYLPGLTFPYLPHAYLVDEHVIYSLALLLLITTHANHIYGVDGWLRTHRPESWLTK
jgi:thiosulfate dehydrogenase [quinone] large subunit